MKPKENPEKESADVDPAERCAIQVDGSYKCKQDPVRIIVKEKPKAESPGATSSASPAATPAESPSQIPVVPGTTAPQPPGPPIAMPAPSAS